MSDRSSAEKVYDGPEAHAALVHLALEREGIRSFVDSDTAFSRNLHGVVYALDANQIDRARDVVARYLKGASVSEATLSPPWTCSVCGEIVEGQFQSCWKCGTAKP